MNSKFYFAGRCSREFGLVIENCPVYQSAKKRIEKIYVPGRNGELVFDTGAYENTSQEYEVWFKGNQSGLTEIAKKISSWLLCQKGYQLLEDDYDTEIYRQAIYEGPVEIANWLLKRGRATIHFQCKPQRFLKTGNEAIIVTAPQTLYNPYMPTLPLLKVYGKGSGAVVVGNTTVTIENISEFIILDSEVQNAYKGTQNQNNKIRLSNYQFPKLQTGENKIAFSGGITKIEIIPRWWLL